MAGKFVDLNEAAKMIGVGPEGLVEMRSKGTIFGYRDGASWKFKVDEVERVIRERGVEARDSDSGILNADDDEFENLISGLSSYLPMCKRLSIFISRSRMEFSTVNRRSLPKIPDGQRSSEIFA